MSTIALPETRPTNGVARVFKDLAYLLGSFPLLLVGFLLTITLLSVGLTTTIIWIGLPIMVAGAFVARGWAAMERRFSSSITGRSLPPSPYRPASPDASAVKRLLHPLADPQTWGDVLWLFLGLIVSAITFSIALTWLAGTIGMVAAPPLTLVLEDRLGDKHTGVLELFHWPFATELEALMQFIVGLGFALTLPLVTRGLAHWQSSMSDAMLNGRARRHAEVSHLRQSRAAVQQAETDALRRLERDIHDGPQQRLVRLNMDLARAKRQASQDPMRAEAMIADAMAATQETLAELRQLSRGIAPPILVDRGLDAAITEAAGRSEIPVTVYTALPDDLPSHVETAAYFVLSEALANANKHSKAESIEVVSAVQDGELFLTVTDDGIGGASLAKGHGLAGLADRLRGVDGHLTLSSPEGGPTTLGAVIPCAS